MLVKLVFLFAYLEIMYLGLNLFPLLLQFIENKLIKLASNPPASELSFWLTKEMLTWAPLTIFTLFLGVMIFLLFKVLVPKHGFVSDAVFGFSRVFSKKYWQPVKK
jgi:hypothetical protein